MNKEVKLRKNGREIVINQWIDPNHAKVVIISPAMGVSRKFYSRMADFFYDQTYNVIVPDYSLIDHHCVQLADWGYKDLPEIIEYAESLTNNSNIYLVGHSIAGQILPLAHNVNKLKAAYLIASQSASHRYWQGIWRIKVDFFWYFLLPFFVSLTGHLPGFVYGGMSLHKHIAIDWREYALNKEGALGKIHGAKEMYRRVNIPVKFLSLERDFIAPVPAVKALFASYGTLQKVYEHLDCDKNNGIPVGHFDFFRQANARFWFNLKSWFEEHNN